MTQTEYENQTEVKRRPIGSVVVEKFRKWSNGGGKFDKSDVYEVDCLGQLLLYRTKEGTDILYTMDDDGNAKKPSVFRKPIEKTFSDWCVTLQK